MKTNAIIIKGSKDTYFGFIADHPAICAQAVTVDGVIASLKKCAQLYFSYMAKTDLEIGTEVVTLK